MNKKLGMGIVVVAIVVAAVFTGCVEKKTSASTRIPTSVVTPSPTPSPTPLLEPKYSRGDVIEIPLTEGEITAVIYNPTTGKNYMTNKEVILDYNSLTDEYKIICVFKEGDEYYFCPEDTTYWLDRFSLERNVSAKITHVNLLTVKSCDDYQTFLHSVYIKHLPVEEIKSKANLVRYNDLYRYNEEWVGEIIRCICLVIQVVEISEDKYAMRAYVTPGIGGDPSGWSYWEDIIWINYEGTRLLEDDIVEIWGEVKGLKTYKSVGGSEITIPEIDALHTELIAEAGDVWWKKRENTNKIANYLEALGYRLTGAKYKGIYNVPLIYRY